MLDFRMNTFLTLCELKSYTHTAEALHITQPAVTQHIHYLEDQYGALLLHKGKSFALTPGGTLLYRFAQGVRAQSNQVEALLSEGVQEKERLAFGATLSIGEFVMPPILADYMKQHSSVHVSMKVENTRALLNKLNFGELDFALVEGQFRRSEYECVRLSCEKLVAVSAPGLFLADSPLTLEKLTKVPLIVREEGSGTRVVLEHALHACNLEFGDFASVLEIGNFKAIKTLVQKGLGITFAYRPVVQRELRAGLLDELTVDKFDVSGEFNFVYLKDSGFRDKYLEFYKYCKSGYEAFKARSGMD